ncbi:hypothetical protein Tco_1014126 [Tanacetum coccineum]
MIHERTNHINVRYHFIRNIVESREIDMTKTETEDNAADAFTKVIPRSKFKNSYDGLEVPVEPVIFQYRVSGNEITISRRKVGMEENDKYVRSAPVLLLASGIVKQKFQGLATTVPKRPGHRALIARCRSGESTSANMVIENVDILRWCLDVCAMISEVNLAGYNDKSFMGNSATADTRRGDVILKIPAENVLKVTMSLVPRFQRILCPLAVKQFVFV